MVQWYQVIHVVTQPSQIFMSMFLTFLNCSHAWKHPSPTQFSEISILPFISISVSMLFLMYMESSRTWPCVAGSHAVHLLSMLVLHFTHVVIFGRIHFCLRLNDTLVCIIFCLSVCPQMDSWVASIFCLSMY